MNWLDLIKFAVSAAFGILLSAMLFDDPLYTMNIVIAAMYVVVDAIRERRATNG